jgi:hypothetical protein
MNALTPVTAERPARLHLSALFEDTILPNPHGAEGKTIRQHVDGIRLGWNGASAIRDAAMAVREAAKAGDLAAAERMAEVVEMFQAEDRKRAKLEPRADEEPPRLTLEALGEWGVMLMQAHQVTRADAVRQWRVSVGGGRTLSGYPALADHARQGFAQ